MKCRGCGETDAEEIFHLSPTAPGPMHIACEFKRLNGLVEEQTGIANEVVGRLEVLEYHAASWAPHYTDRWRFVGEVGLHRFEGDRLEDLAQWFLENGSAQFSRNHCDKKFSEIDRLEQRLREMETKVKSLCMLVAGG